MDEGKLHSAIVTALNGYSAAQTEVAESACELAQMAQSHGTAGSMSQLELKQKLDALSAEQAVLLDKVLENMDNQELNAQLRTLAEEKQSILEQISQLEQQEAQQAIQTSRMDELRKWLKQQSAVFTEYDDEITRRMVARITVIDANTIRIRLRDDVELEQKLC